MACVVPSWALGLRAGNLCFEGIINRDLLESALELHKRDTVSTFGTRSSRRTGKRVEGDEKEEKKEIKVNRLNERVRTSTKLCAMPNFINHTPGHINS